MKKSLSVLGVVLLAATVLFVTSCQPRDTGPVTLRVGMWDQNQAWGIELVLAEFTAETGIMTSLEVTPWFDYWTLMEAAATGGAMPDVFWMHSNEVQRYMAAGLLMDLTDRIARSPVTDMANFPSEIVGLYASRGRQYAIPKDIDFIGLWFNKRHFEAAGIPFPTDNWTWNDFRNAARALTNPAIGQFGTAFTPSEPHTGYWNFIYQNDGYVISADRRRSGFDNPRTIEALEFLIGMLQEGIMPPLTVTAETDKMALLQSGVISMAFFGSWMLTAFSQSDFFLQNTDVVMLPASNTGRRATIYNGLGWSAAANTAHPEEAWRLLEFLGSERIQRRLSETGISISAFRGTLEPFIQAFPEFNVAALVNSMPYGVMRPYSINTIAWENYMVQQLNEAWALNRPVADVSRDIALRMNALLAAE